MKRSSRLAAPLLFIRSSWVRPWGQPVFSGCSVWAWPVLRCRLPVGRLPWPRRFSVCGSVLACLPVALRLQPVRPFCRTPRWFSCCGLSGVSVWPVRLWLRQRSQRLIPLLLPWSPSQVPQPQLWLSVYCACGPAPWVVPRLQLPALRLRFPQLLRPLAGLQSLPLCYSSVSGSGCCVFLQEPLRQLRWLQVR